MSASSLTQRSKASTRHLEEKACPFCSCPIMFSTFLSVAFATVDITDCPIRTLCSIIGTMPELDVQHDILVLISNSLGSAHLIEAPLCANYIMCATKLLYAPGPVNPTVSASFLPTCPHSRHCWTHIFFLWYESTRVPCG